MTHYSLVVLSNPVAGREDEYNRWYSEQHLQDVLRIPGFVAAQRFRIADDSGAAPHRYLALYELETNDLATALGELGKRAGTPAMPISEALDTATVSMTPFAAITGRIEAER
jgi:hypothetical protein